MQLQLLKLETDAYAGESMMVSSDEDAGVSEEKGMKICIGEESWESSYIADVLVESGYNSKREAEVLVAGGEPLECGVSPRIFEKLEKVYGEDATGLKWERRLVFDRVSWAVMEVQQRWVSPHPWVGRGPQEGSRWWGKERVEAEIYKMLGRREGEEVERESEWLSLGGDVDAIGIEIEGLVMDELVDELLVSL